MAKLDGIPLERLQTELGGVTEAKAAKRLMVAIAYKSGVDVDTLSERYAIPQSTIYYWLDRFEQRSFEDALEDEAKPGRPPKLSDQQHEEVQQWLGRSPTEFGYETSNWTAGTLRDQISAAFDVEYSVPHVKRRFLE